MAGRPALLRLIDASPPHRIAMPILYFCTLAVLASFTVLLARRSHINLASGAGWVLMTLVHGLFIKPLFVLADFPSPEILDITLFQQTNRHDYWLWGTVLLFAYAAFVAAMFAAGRYHRPVRPRPAPRAEWFDTGMLTLLLLLAAVGVVGFFVQFPQLLESANKNSIATADVAEYSSGGGWRTLISLSYLISLCALANVGQRHARRASLALFLASAGVWLVFCFLSDQRGSVLFSVITYLIAYSRFIGPLPRKAVLTVLLVLTAAIVGKTAMRLQSENGGQDEIAAVAANFVGPNLVENGKTVSVIQAIPAKIEHQLGKTYLDAVLILVPRALYPAKETVNLDTVIGNQVFDCNAFGACGVPPGLMAESYLNFGVLGVVVLAIAMGALVGKIDHRYRCGRRSVTFDLFYMYSLVYCGMAILGSGASSVLTQQLTQGITFGFVLLAAKRRARRQAPQALATA